MRTAVRLLLLVAALLPATGSPGAAEAGQAMTCDGALVPVSSSTDGVRHHFVLRQTGLSACSVASHPLVSLTRDGHRVPVRVQVEAGGPQVVPPDALVSFSVAALGRSCRAADTLYAGLSPAEDAVAFRGVAVPACPGGRLSVSAFRVALPAPH